MDVFDAYNPSIWLVFPLGAWKNFFLIAVAFVLTTFAAWSTWGVLARGAAPNRVDQYRLTASINSSNHVRG